MRQSVLTIAALVTAALSPSVAEAHLIVTGMGPIYDGVTHFGLSPEDLLPVLAVALFAGLRGAVHARVSLLALALAWFAGGVLTSAIGLTLPPILAPALTAGLLLAIGGMLAADLRAAPWACAVATVALGLIRGAADLSGAAPGPGAVLNTLGMTAAAAALFALACSITLPLRRLWMIVAARVAGSWMAAVGLLLAGWLIRFGAKAIS